MTWYGVWYGKASNKLKLFDEKPKAIRFAKKIYKKQGLRHDVVIENLSTNRIIWESWELM